MSDATRAEVCAVACADAYRDDGEIIASAFGTVPAIGVRLARHTFSPDLVLSDGEATAMRGTWALGGPADGEVEAWLPFNQIFTLVWNGKRHITMIPTQLDAYGNANISAIGDHAKPTVQLLGVRGAPATPCTTRPATGFPPTAPACSSRRSTWCRASATTMRGRRDRRRRSTTICDM
ncbi:hypothetical protein [Microbacterium sp. Se5.02b]|uniref:hypothetical protein n=1 Tax=Microbacterium sp. Se5.02b TaxID=2864103 RepID=UPI001C692AFF|nr:hypothetical protein [Microbacterium sp. Se5.02b]QYM63930.1 hypothetical protein K1X59_17720 [Microbacterium sp. Se5.02b]